jgi:dipeptidyl aminopeptidase/acylaminoacyl peptidase
MTALARFPHCPRVRSAVLAVACAAGGLALAALPGSASATAIAGPNGKIVYASGRASQGIPAPAANDADARIWVADSALATPVQVTTLPASTQHRHPNWSPDHTKIVYAAGPAFTGPFAIWIVDLRTGDQSEFVPAAPGQDRPTWSPDGTKIAYGSQGSIWVKDVAPGSQPVQITNGATDQRPVWSPDGNTLYFNRGAAGNRDLYQVTPVASTGTVTGVLTTPTDDWQPAVSPDGKRLCFLRGGQDNTADIFTVNVDGNGVTPLSTTPGVGDLNCVWSPDGSRVLFTLGAFGAGDLESTDKNGNDPQLLTSLNVAAHFDGNADWATNFSPRCDSRTSQVAVNGFVRITLACVDPDAGSGASAPAPAPIDPQALAIGSRPSHGNIGGISDSGQVVYTPKQGFRGTDSFTYTGNDEVSDSAPAKITVEVGTGRAGPDSTAPELAALKVSPRRFRLALGTTISFRLSEPGKVTLGFQRASAGRLSGHRCVKVTPRNRTHGHCTRFVAAGSSPRLSAGAGLDRVRFRGRLSHGHRLVPGSYRLRVSAVDAAGNASRPLTGPSFTIVPG